MHMMWKNCPNTCCVKLSKVIFPTRDFKRALQYIRKRNVLRTEDLSKESLKKGSRKGLKKKPSQLETIPLNSATVTALIHGVMSSP